jgi:hypothetical protein
MKEKIDELATNSKDKNIRKLYRVIYPEWSKTERCFFHCFSTFL